MAGGRQGQGRGSGPEVEKLREHGFYAFHDIPLPGLGNADHIVLGERGFFCIETKSYKGRVTANAGGLLVNGRPPETGFINQT